MKCLKRNLHIFCEKPMAHTWAEAERILEEAKSERTGHSNWTSIEILAGISISSGNSPKKKVG